MLQSQPLHPLKYDLQIFTDTSKEGRGTHLRENTARSTGPFQKANYTNYLLELNSACHHRQHHSGCQQTRRGGVRVGCGVGGGELRSSVCPTVENPDLVMQETGDSQIQTNPRPPNNKCDGRHTTQARPDHPDREVPLSRGLQSICSRWH